FQAEDGIRDRNVTGVQTCALPIFCCALIPDPDLLILDEPTTGVDPLARAQFWDLIDRIREDRPEMSVIVATAYMDEAERFKWLKIGRASCREREERWDAERAVETR